MSVPSTDDLVESSAWWLTRALASWWVDGEDKALALAGISFEHLCKAYLRRLSPTLIVDTRNAFDSLLGALELGHLKQRTGEPTHTISAKEAWERVHRVHAFKEAPDHLILLRLIDVRNGGLHAGTVTGVVRRKIFVEFLKVSLELRVSLDDRQDDATVLGEYSDPVSKLFSENRQHIEEDVERRFKRAELHLKEALTGVSADKVPDKRRELQEIERAKISLAGIPEGPSSDESGWFINRVEQATCPTPNCNDSNATAIGFTYYSDDPDDETVWFLPVKFSCGVCALRLPNPDHLQAAGMSRRWALPDEARLFATYEPLQLE